MLDVSIVIISWNTRDILAECLQSIFDQTEGIQYEVIVIDNASADDSPEMVKTQFSGTTLLANDRNVGFAAGNNQGIAIAQGRYVLLLNSDTIVLDNAIAKLVSYMDNHSDTGICGCRVLNPDMTLQPTCFMFPSLINLALQASYLPRLFPKNRFFGRERMTWWDRQDERSVEVVTGCCLMARKAGIGKVGLLDEDYFIYAEETDWCLRFARAGWEIRFVPDAEIIHLGGQSTRQMKPAMELQKWASILLFIKKHHSFMTYWLSCVCMSLFFLIRIPYWFLKGLYYVGARGMCLAYCRGLLAPITGWKGLRYHP